MNIYVTGTAMTKFGELWDKDIRDLALEAATSAIRDAEITAEKVDALLVANMSGSSFAGQDHLGSLISGELGLDVPAMRIEGACASGSLAINAAKQAILAGTYSNILVVGVEKMTDVSGGDATKGLARAADEELEGFFGVTFPSLYAMMAREYMRKYKVTRKELAEASVVNHEHGLLNPKAHFRRAISVADVLNSADVSEPLGLLDCSPISDGAAALVLSAEKKSPVELVASEIATSSISLHERKSITSLDAAVKAARKAYKAAGIKASDLDLVELHDCFSIAELIALEDLGLSNRGQAGYDLRRGKFSREGELPVNTSGGLKSCGHPVGATGIKQAHEITRQLRGNAGDRQIRKDLKYGLTHNVGGSGGTAVVNIFKKS
jgi:acetyl-CoA C-acetyltransferase